MLKENTEEPGITSFQDNPTCTAYVEKGDAQGLITPGDDLKARLKQSILIWWRNRLDFKHNVIVSLNVDAC